MVDLALLDRFLLNRLPITVEETIVKVDRRLTDQVVAEEIVVVVSLDLDHGRTWELTGKLEQLVELGVRLVELVVVALGELAVTAPDEEVRVGEGPNVAACEVKTLKHIELNLAGGLAEELLLDDLIVAGILKEFKKLWLVDIHRVQQCAKLLKFLSACNVLNRLELQVLLEHLLVDLADEVEDAVHMALFLLIEDLSLFLVDNLDAPLEVAHDFLVADLAGLVQLVRDDEGEPGFGEAAGLAALDRDLDEGVVGVGEQILVVLELVLVVLPVVQVGDARLATLLLLLFELASLGLVVDDSL